MKRSVVCLPILSVVLLITALLSLGVGAVTIAPGRILQILTEHSGNAVPATELTIIWELRLPRLLLACFVGAGLGMAGAGYQGLFRNPLADPFVIGASSGAALGATLAIINGWQGHVLGLACIPAASLIGALGAVAIVYSIATVGRQIPMVSLLLAGVALSSMLGAIVSLLMFLHEEKLMTIFSWLMGSLSGRGWPALWSTAPLILIGGLILWMHSRALDALTFGEESAASLGLGIRRLRATIVLSASLITAASVAGGGIIGFVGLIAPHMARSLVGARHALVIPMSGLLGALLLLLADDVARTIVAPSELPVGIVTALMGSPFFLYLLKTRQRELGVGQ
ncbi:MAG: transport system permease protein [Planctomycetaceae bacterium]|nr:transport system permease protein [Planctomycetaceae bacterium]